MCFRESSLRMGDGGVALKEGRVQKRRYTALAAALESYKKSREEALREQERLVSSTMKQLVTIARDLGLDQGGNGK